MKSFSQLLLEKNNKTSSKKGISDSEINKRLSASTTKGDQARSQYDADGGYGDSNVGDATTNKSLKKGKPFTKAQSDAIQIRSLSKKTKKFVNKPGTTKSKGPGASTGGQKNLVVNPKSKGTTPVTISKTKTVKQSEVSKKALEFTAKVNKRRIERGTKKAERIKDATGGKKTGSLRKGNLSFAGDRSGATKQAKVDIEFKKSLKKAGGSGDIGFTAPDRKTKVTKRTTRAIKQGTPDPFTTPKPKKPIAPFGTKKVTTSAPEFGKGDTKGQMNVKAMNKKSFKVTQPKDLKLPKSKVGRASKAALIPSVIPVKNSLRLSMNPVSNATNFWILVINAPIAFKILGRVLINQPINTIPKKSKILPKNPLVLL